MQWQSLEETPSGDGVYGFEPLQPKTHPGTAMKVSQVWDVSPSDSAENALGQLKTVISKRRVHMIDTDCIDFALAIKPYIFCEVLSQLDA
jgi:hypothetical protein